jgi:hypothetical protein
VDHAAHRGRRRLAIAVGAAVVVVVLITAIVLAVQRSAGAGPAAQGQEPAGARAAVGLLLSAGGRKAVAPDMASVLGPGRLFPPGATFSAKPGTWHQVGSFANVTGILQVPGRAALLAEIGFMWRGGQWLVTFEAQK